LSLGVRNLKKDTTETSTGTGFYGQTKHRKSFLAENRDKKYPMSTVEYTAVSTMLWACFSARGPEHLVQMYGIVDSNIKINTKMCL